MRVVINQLATLGRKTGIGHYVEQILRHFRLAGAEEHIEAFPNGWVRCSCKVFARLRPLLLSGSGTPSQVPGAASLDPTFKRLSLDYLRQRGKAIVGARFRARCSSGRYDLYHEPNFIPFPCDCPTVTTLHDLSVLLHPHWHPRDRVLHYERNFKRCLDQSVHFLTVSDFTRQEIIRVLGIRPERITRIYNGVRSGFRPLAPESVATVLRQLRLPSSYLLCLGTIEPRKNVGTLLSAYCAVPAQLRERCPLVLVGHWGWNAGEIAAILERESGARSIIHLGYVRERHLAAVYNAARALLYPSHYEGFGLPPLEMMACGGAVLASTAGALVETVGRQAHLIHPSDVDGWRRAIVRVIEDDDWRHSLRAGAQDVARPYTWGRCARETLNVYRALVSNTKPLDQNIELATTSLGRAG
jgi:alpha-1,3-rhamnosyl/mannosyltransferase